MRSGQGRTNGTATALLIWERQRMQADINLLGDPAETWLFAPSDITCNTHHTGQLELIVNI